MAKEKKPAPPGASTFAARMVPKGLAEAGVPPEGYAPKPDPALIAYWAHLAELTSQEEAQTRDPVWMAGYRHGVMDMMRRAAELPPGTLATVKQEAERLEAAFKAYHPAPTPSETPGQKSARLRRQEREERDHAQGLEFAALINAGDSTETARQKMGIGDVRARRLRRLAVERKWLEAHRKPAVRRRVAPK